MNEYPNVFLDELQGFPPEREIDSGNDVLPDTQPISPPPYRLNPAELRELKEQQRDLLEKGFIQPSTLPWVRLCCLCRKKTARLECVSIIGS